MPYPRAHYYVSALLVFVLLAFWPTFFSDLGTPPLAFRVHGITATLWVLLLIAQSWVIHNKRASLHRQMGKLALILFPLFLMGLMMVIQTASVAGAAMQPSPLEQIIIPGIGAVSIITVVVVSYLFYRALANRRNVRLHAGYLLATPFLLIESVFTRIFNFYVPGLTLANPMTLENPTDVAQFSLNFHLSELLAISVAFYLYARDRRYGTPFLFVGIAMILHSASYQWVGPALWWRAIYYGLADLPATAVVICGLVLGGLVTWLGWSGADRPSRQSEAVAK